MHLSFTVKLYKYGVKSSQFYTLIVMNDLIKFIIGYNIKI